jgi:hypothetical protein
MKRGGSKAASERVVRPRSLSTHKSGVGTFRTSRAVGLESGISSKADLQSAPPFKLIYFVLVDGQSLVADNLMQS